MRHIFLDTETTGLYANQGHRIIEIAAIEIINRRPTNNSFHFYINYLKKIILSYMKKNLLEKIMLKH